MGENLHFDVGVALGRDTMEFPFNSPSEVQNCKSFWLFLSRGTNSFSAQVQFRPYRVAWRHEAIVYN